MNPRCFLVGVVLLALAAANTVAATALGAEPGAATGDARLTTRRHLCREQRAAGDRRNALAACQWIVARGGSAEDLRLAVAALVDMKEAPTPEQLLEANTLAGAAVRVAPDQPWGYAARCDIARRWQDPSMVADCLADLQRVAPRHPETARVLALSSTRSRVGLVAGWLLVIGIVALTAIQRVRAWRANRPVRPTTASAATVAITVMAALLVATPARAEGPPPLPPIDDANPAASVPSAKERDADPLKFGYYLQELIDRAQRASQRGDHQAAARYYVAMARAVPHRAVAFGKLCASLEAAGLRERALTACNEALGRPGVTVEDFTRFVRLTLAKPGKLTETEIKQIDDAVKHLGAQPGSGLVSEHLACELATRLDGPERLERCTDALVKAAPHDPKTVYFQWALAVRKQDRDQARALVERARASGMGEDGVGRMSRATDELSAGGWLGLRYWKTGLLLLILIVGMTIALTRRPVRTA